jgi:hypothetical protein
MFMDSKYLFATGLLIGAVYCGLSQSHDLLFTLDSPGYTGFSPARTAGYPLYLATLGVTLAVKLQPILYIIAVFALWREMSRALDGKVWASVFVLLCLVNPELNSYHYSVMTESLFMSVSILAMACMLRFLREPSLSAAILASIFVGLSATVRPSAYALIPVLLPMVLFRWRAVQGRRITLLAAALLPAMLLCAMERIGTQAYHGAATTSLAGRMLYAKAAMLDAPPAEPSTDPRKSTLQNALQFTFAPVRQILPAIPRWDVREIVSEAYENCLGYACSRDLKDSLILPEPAVNSLAKEVALERIASAPTAFAALVLERYRSLWTIYQLSNPDAGPVFKAFIDEHRPLPFEQYMPEFSITPQPSSMAAFLRPAVLAAGAVTFLLTACGLLAAFYRNLDVRLAGASLASLAVHASLLFTALVGVGIRRYTFGVWPIMMAALILGAAWASTLAIDYKQALRQRPL